ncbi:aminoglycoside 6-adenylyltransferase [Paenibacillus campi]|uniref:aminoglycoside 6-adenylyltransferase n=1 Tax=Paenibacillus campi TaxID=3106031 RepID=UPI002B000B50|nr:aminoglycoside 6-adenylyltransferase [Paenibacillus sp. SGZ-1009]
MRSQQQMMELIMDVAHRNPHIRAVAMNGSRVNPHVRADLFQDYDVVYLVDTLEPFVQEHRWVDVFGERIMMQMPDESNRLAGESLVRFMYLMQFADGNRIDLRLQRIDHWREYIDEDRLTVILLDKDGVLPELALPDDTDYRVKRPTAAAFTGCCNEFWWVSMYIAKGLWRQELLYALDMMNRYARPMLEQLLCWEAGYEHAFQISTGKSGKYLPLYLDESICAQLFATYPAAHAEAIWQSLFVMSDLFAERARWLAERLGYVYDEGEAQRVRAHLTHVYHLPADASHLYE